METKEATVVILPTDKAENAIIKKGNQLKHEVNLMTQSYLKSINCSSHHLYIIDDSEIKEGDWYLATNEVTKCSCKEEANDLTNNCKKIIATTDPELTNLPQELKALYANRKDVKVPQPSKAFIEAWCKAGGINKVLVEYEEPVDLLKLRRAGTRAGEKALHQAIFGLQLKVNSHNEITIHPIKDSWSRDEVIQLCSDAMLKGTALGREGKSLALGLVEFVEEKNL